MAAAAEELSASGQEIARIVEESTAVARSAVEEASKANEGVMVLDEAAQKIGGVVSLINEIAGQTNLLALNATIEEDANASKEDAAPTEDTEKAA